MNDAAAPQPLRHRLHEIIFEADTPLGKAFDLVLLVAILASIISVMVESSLPPDHAWRPRLYIAEWVFTVLFTIEYALRLYCVRRPLKWAGSFYGIVDLIAILPTYISLFIPGAQQLLVTRVLRLLRTFRILKLTRYLAEATELGQALQRSVRKILVFVLVVFSLVTILGTIMHLVEGAAGTPGFETIPRAIYWAVVTLTTVGYGDVVPLTAAGKVITTVLMVTGYGIIAVPTGIVSAEIAAGRPRGVSTQACPSCGKEGHDLGARHCKHCGALL